LLDSYEAERRAAGEEVVARTTRSVQSQKLEPEGRLADTQILVSYRGGAWLENAMPDGPAQCRSAPTAIWSGVVNPGAIWQFATNSTKHLSPKTAFRHGADEERDSQSMPPKRSQLARGSFPTHCRPGDLKASYVVTVVAVHLLAATAPWHFSAPGLIAFVVLFFLTGPVGINLGFHRLLSHRSFRLHPNITRCFALLGTLALQGGPISWVGNHRTQSRPAVSPRATG
jgi:hypothetical protein